MARVIYIPDQHRCHVELKQLDQPDPMPVGTVAECSCGTRHVKRDDQRDGPYWAKKS